MNCNCKKGWPYWIWKLYLEWIDEKKLKKEEHPIEEYYWRFKVGDCVSRQGYHNYSEYIQDCACQIPKNRDLNNNLNNLKEENIKTKLQFGVRWSL
jgi:hypothetical protein